jgi:superfamily II DNA or RNA helicase
MIFITPNKQHIVVPWREDMEQLIPHARTFEHGGERLLVVPNGHDEAKVCRNLGVPVPAPILTRYEWDKFTPPPWQVQKTTSALLTESRRAYVLNDLGTGKTRAAIWAADYLMRRGIGPTLVTAPLSVLTPVWEQELFKLFPQARVKILHGPKKRRLEMLNEPAEWYVINHHGLVVLGDALVKRGFQIVIIDELAVFRTRGTGLWRGASAVVNAPRVKYAWGMTGSPTPTAPTDAHAQIRLLTPDRVTKSSVRFRDSVMRQVTDFRWVARPTANDVVFAAMQPSVRFALEDVTELPPTRYDVRKVPLEKDTAKAYKLLFDKMAMTTNNGESITAVNEGVLQTKLLQVACGYIYTDKRGVYELPSQPRRDALLDYVNGTSRKVIVFVPFIHALTGITKFLEANKVTVATVNGSTARMARDRIFQAFQNAPDPRVLVAHPQCMAHGLTLTAANTIVWYCLTSSNEIYEQANARIVRPGQTSKTLIAHLVGTPVERETYARLRDRGKMQGLLLDLFRKQELEF